MMQPMQDEITKVIANDLGIGDLAVAEQEQLISQFGEVALKAATIAVMEKLPEAKRDEFAKLAESGDATAIKAFLDVEVPGHEDIAKAAVQAEVQKFKDFQKP